MSNREFSNIIFTIYKVEFFYLANDVQLMAKCHISKMFAQYVKCQNTESLLI